MQEETLRTLAASPFNKVRMCIFPKYYTYNTTDPERYAFPGDRENGFDFERFDPEFWERLEKRIGQLDDLGIQADIFPMAKYTCSMNRSGGRTAENFTGQVRNGSAS